MLQLRNKYYGLIRRKPDLITENVDITINRGNIKSSGNMLTDLYNTIIDRKNNPKEGSYTNYLFDKGINKILKKVGEESSEILIAAKDNDKQEVIFEVADFMYHVTVMMASLGVSWEDVEEELSKRD